MADPPIGTISTAISLVYPDPSLIYGLPDFLGENTSGTFSGPVFQTPPHVSINMVRNLVSQGPSGTVPPPLIPLPPILPLVFDSPVDLRLTNDPSNFGFVANVYNFGDVIIAHMSCVDSTETI